MNTEKSREIYTLTLFREGVLSSVKRNGEELKNVVAVTASASVYQPTRLWIQVEPDEINVTTSGVDAEYLTDATE